MSNGALEIKDANQSQIADIKRTKRKQPTDGNIFIGLEESSSKSKRMKIVQVKKHNGKGRPKKPINVPVPDLDKVKPKQHFVNIKKWKVNHSQQKQFQITHHASPKIWDMFERFQNFSKRRVLKRHPSGLLDASADETTEKDLKSNSQLDNGENIKRNNDQSCKQSSEVSGDNESSIGGDRKRRCVEISNYEDELSCAGKREPQPASAFKPKCLNFDNIEDS